MIKHYVNDYNQVTLPNCCGGCSTEPTGEAFIEEDDKQKNLNHVYTEAVCPICNRTYKVCIDSFRYVIDFLK